ncbi:MAG: tripartite tricarboxylate transporter substrate binding protein, partial [Casimicrobiaceae bacterium]
MNRRKVLTLLGSMLVAPGVDDAIAQQAYPNKPVKVISPFPPGGPAESIARLLAIKLNATLGQPLIVDYKP